MVPSVDSCVKSGAISPRRSDMCASFGCLALFPRQAGLAPAAEGTPMALAIEVAFEAFENVVRRRESRLRRERRRMVRAHGAAAEEEQRALRRIEPRQLLD